MGFSGAIPGVTPKALTRAWTATRRELRGYTYRDPIDHLEYDIDPEVWIRRLLLQLRQGTYRPDLPSSALLAKTRGFCRWIAYPSIPDLVLYRCLADELLARARKHECEHCYFEQGALAQAQRKAQEAATIHDVGDEWGLREIEEWILDYDSRSNRRYRTWLQYNQYRKHLIFSRVFRYIVVTDIANYFDSIAHSHIYDVFTKYSSTSRLARLMELMLSAFSLHPTTRPSDRIGIPIDEADCSRRLAHVLLFEHDARMIDAAGGGAYVRWMDDQNIGAASREDALDLVALCQESLRVEHLFANSGKTQILTTSEAKRHFHFTTNERLDKAEALPRRTQRELRQGRAAVRAAWTASQGDVGIGHWEKVLKRFYLLHGRFGSRALRARAVRDCLSWPTMSVRILAYMRAVCTIPEYLAFIDALLASVPKAYPDVAQHAIESMLLLEPTGTQQKAVREIGSLLLQGKHRCSSLQYCKAIAPLLFLRFGDRRQLPTLERVIAREWHKSSVLLVRSCGLVYASAGRAEMKRVRRLAAANARNRLADQILLFDKMASTTQMPSRLRARFDLRWDPVAQRNYIDMRSMLVLRLFRVLGNKAIDAWISAQCSAWMPKVSRYDQDLIARLL